MNPQVFLEPRLIGYARVSTGDQDLSLQIDSLLAHGVKREHIFCDKLSRAASIGISGADGLVAETWRQRDNSPTRTLLLQTPDLHGRVKSTAGHFTC